MILNSPYISGSSTITGNLNVLGTITGSINSAISASYANNSTSASYALNATSASYALVATSASYAANADLLDGRDSLTFANTGSNSFVGSQNINGSVAITGSLTTTGAITAQTLNVQQVTSSIVYSSGSNIFGNSVSNTQSMTGSVGISGSLTVTGDSTITGVLTLNSTISNGTYTYTLPSATGTLALTSALGSYVPYTGANQTLAMGTNNGITLTDTGTSVSITITSSSTGQGAIVINKSVNGQGVTVNNAGIGYGIYSNNSSTGAGIAIGNSSTGKGLYIDNGVSATGDPFVYTLGGAAFVKTKIDYLGNITGVAATLTGALSGTSATFSASTNALNIGNSQNSAIALSTFGKTSTSGYATANNYLQIGAGENATSSTRLIGFGYSITANTNQPAYIGYIETSNTGETKGSLIFGTRDVTTDTAPTTRLTIASTGAATFSGNTSDSLIIGSVAGNYIKMGGIASSTSYLYSFETAFNVGNSFSGGSLNLYAGNASRLTITSGGNVGIGVNAPTGQLSLKNQISNGSTPVASYAATNGVDGQNFLNGYYAANSDGYGSYPRYLDIVSVGSPDGSNGGSNIRLFTNPIANSSPAVERMRITSGGNVLFGRITSGLTNSEGTTISGGSIQPESTGYVFYGNRTTSDGLFIGIRRNNVDVGSITVTTSATAFNTSSDYRLKTDFKDYNGLNLINSIKTYDYAWVIDNTRAYGVKAHELSKVIPNAVFGEKDEINEDGSVKSQAVDYSKLVPILIKAIQELNAKITELENK